MLFIFKFFIYFLISFVILSFPVGKQTIFEIAHKYTHPITKDITDYLSKKTKLGYDHSKKFLKNFIQGEEDTVKSGLSSVKKTKRLRTRRKVKRKKIGIRKPMGNYTPEEKMMLERILNSSRSD